MNTEVFDLGKIGITLGGEYDNKVIYEKLTIVSYKGKSYISTKTVQGISPEQDIRSWQLVAEAKDAYHMLVDAGKTTLTEEEFLIQLVDATKGRYIVQGNITNAADEEDLTIEHSALLGIDTLKLANRDNTNGMGYVILRKNKSFTEQVTKENTIYEIRYDFDLNGGEINIPEGCVLDFQGGSLSNGTIIGNNTIINSGNFKIFNINIDFGGTWNIEHFNVLWMGAIGDEVFDNTEIFNKIFNTFNNIYIPKGRYVTNSIIIEKSLISFHFYGNSNYSNAYGNNDTAFIYNGTDYFLTLKKPCYNGIIEKFTIILGSSAKGGIYYNDIFHTITRFISIDNRISSIHTQACGFTIAGNGFSNLLTNIQCRYLHKGIEIISTGDDNWLNNTQIGLVKGDIYIIRGHYGIELQKGTGIILKGVAIENMENDAIIINDIGSINPMTVFYSNGYIENIKGYTFNITPKDTRYRGVNLFVDNVEFHIPTSNNFCINNGTNPCFVKIQDCIGLFIAEYEHALFKGNLMLDLINKSIQSAENIHFFSSPIPLHESYISESKYISALATKAFTLGSANENIYGSYNLSKTSILVKTVLLRSTWNKIRKGLGGDLFYPLALSKGPAYGDKYIYNARLYLYRITDDKLSNSRIDYNSENMCCIDIFNNGEIKKIFGGDVFDSYNFTKFQLTTVTGKISSTRYVCLVINNYINSSTPELDYSLGIVAEIECIGAPHLNKTIVNYGKENIRQLRCDLWDGYDTIFDTITKKWLYKDIGTMNWKDIEDNIIY